MPEFDLPLAISESLYNVLGAVDPDLLLEAACNVIADLELTEETVELRPISVPDVDENGNRLMDDRFVIPQPKWRFEWVTQKRWVTPYRDVGARWTSEELSNRLAAAREGAE